MPMHCQPVRICSLMLTLMLTTALAGCSNDGSAEAAPAGNQPVAVRAAAVTLAADPEPLRFAGVVRARQRARLTFQVGGVLRSKAVEIGQSVEQGQTLATLYNPELEPARNAARARLAELRAQADQAEREAQRSDQLFQRGVISAQQREQQRARLDALNAGVGSARASLSQTEQLQEESELRAPFDGRIDAILVEPGEFVAPGQPVMRLAASNGVEVEVLVPGRMLENLTVGQSMAVWTALTDQRMEGVVAEIGLGSSQGSALYPLVVALEDQSVRTGDAVEVGVGRQVEKALQIPMAAVMRSADGSGAGLTVFRVTADRAERVPVQVSDLRGEWAILRGDTLGAGDRVIYAGLTRLSEGDAVELLP